MPVTVLMGLRERLEATRLCLVTDLTPPAGSFVEVAAAAVRGGAGMVEIRDRHAGIDQIAQAVDALRTDLGFTSVLVAVHGDAALYRAARADLVHLPAGGGMRATRRGVAPHGLVGRSAHDAAELDGAWDADFLVVGPVNPGRAATARLGTGRGGLDVVRSAASRFPATEESPMVWFAAGGIDIDLVDEVVAAGAGRIAVGRAITGATDPGRAARDLTTALDRALVRSSGASSEPCPWSAS